MKDDTELVESSKRRLQYPILCDWVHVDDELPEFDTPVLVCNTEEMYVAKRWKQKSGSEFFKSIICPCCNVDKDFETITYWTRLPEMP